MEHDVLAQQALDVFGHVLPPDDKGLVSVDAPLGPELGHEALEEVLRAALHHGADLLKVDPHRLLDPHTRELWGLHCVPLLLGEVRVLCVEDTRAHHFSSIF
jgi:hypothetical protein